MAIYSLATQTAATFEPVSLDEAKLQCGVAEDNEYFNTKLRDLIKGARQKVEADTGRALCTQTLDFTIDCWPYGLEPIYLPRSPVASITHVKYYDTTGSQQTLNTSVYKTLLSREPAEIRLKHSQQWPSLYGEPGVVEVRMVCGYAITAVPGVLKQAVLLQVHNMFDPAATGDIEDAYRSMVATYSVGDEFHAYAR